MSVAHERFLVGQSHLEGDHHSVAQCAGCWLFGVHRENDRQTLLGRHLHEASRVQRLAGAHSNMSNASGYTYVCHIMGIIALR
eukprot:4929360-Amphidinium_carterae.1